MLVIVTRTKLDMVARMKATVVYNFILMPVLKIGNATLVLEPDRRPGATLANVMGLELQCQFRRHLKVTT